MDLIDFDRGIFDNIVDDFEELLRGANYHPIPISALDGDNVITNSNRTPWFDGRPLLGFLENVEVDRNATLKPFRLPVQIVLRPNHDFRGFAGQIASGIIRPGDTVTALPSGRSSKVKRIATWDGDLELAHAPMSVTLTLEDEIDISRGDVLVADARPAALGHHPSVEKRFEAEMVWMDERPLDPSRVYLLKHATRVVAAEVNRGLVLNQIGTVTITTARPVVFDAYVDNRATGSFILIDPATNFTAGAGMITRPVQDQAASVARPSAAERLVQLARNAPTEAAAVELVRLALEDILK
jgi:sulfate adenylyltransferase subunit 1 (EFTu-like GTPase family)